MFPLCRNDFCDNGMISRVRVSGGDGFRCACERLRMLRFATHARADADIWLPCAAAVRGLLSFTVLCFQSCRVGMKLRPPQEDRNSLRCKDCWIQLK